MAQKREDVRDGPATDGPSVEQRQPEKIRHVREAAGLLLVARLAERRFTGRHRCRGRRWKSERSRMGQRRSDGHDRGGTNRGADRKAARHDGRRFKWKDGQKEKARAVLRSIEGGDEEAAQLSILLAFVETFVYSKVYHESFDSPTVHFLAVLGIDEENDRLRTGNDYLYRVAGLVNVSVCLLWKRSCRPSGEQHKARMSSSFFLEQRRQYLDAISTWAKGLRPGVPRSTPKNIQSVPHRIPASGAR